MRKILVLRGGALGDFIVTLPALAFLRQHWPEARIELVGNAVAAALARNRGLLDAVHSQHDARWSALFGAGPLPAPLAAWLGEFDLVLNYWPDPDGELRGHFPTRPGQTFLAAPSTPTTKPAAAHYCEPLRSLGLEPDEHWYHLKPLMKGPAGGRRGTAIHPGSGSPAKNWPADRWRTVIENLAEPVLLILGEAEAKVWSSAPKDLASQQAIEVAANLPLEDLVTALSGCRRFLGHDSGISHLAAACETPCVLLFGPTDPAMWAPPAPHVRVLQRGPRLEALSVADVLAALRE